jgi:hypothetical protein
MTPKQERKLKRLEAEAQAALERYRKYTEWCQWSPTLDGLQANGFSRKEAVATVRRMQAAVREARAMPPEMRWLQ